MYLSSLIEEEFRLLPPQKAALKRLGLVTIKDLIYHFPARYSDVSHIKNIVDLVKGERAAVYGKVTGLKLSKGFRSRVAMAKGMLEDTTGRISLVWFNQPYIAKMIPEGSVMKFEGTVSEGKQGKYLSNPEFESVEKVPLVTGDSLFGEGGESMSQYPVYPESRGITSKWFYHAVQKVFKSGLLDTMNESLPEEILKRYNLPSLKTALVWIHSPRKLDDAMAARKRFAFEEVFFIQLEKQKERHDLAANPSFVIEKTEEELEKFTSRFPFKETEAQAKAIRDVLADFKQNRPMARLLEGDVGSGKTAVAATTAYAVITSRPKGQDYGALQIAYMCPTEILAKQHFESFIKYFSHLGINIALITSSGCKKFPSKIHPTGTTDISRSQLLKWIQNGEIPILIGTHALIQKAVKFKHLAYVIIDEQHRFGTAQRQKLARKDDSDFLREVEAKKKKIPGRKSDIPTGPRLPHLLSMTATPIPRTLALTIFGDLDLTLLDQMPVGRKPIITDIIPPNKRAEAYELVRAELQAGRQAYVICPRINEPDPSKEMALNAKSVKEESKRLKKEVFPEYEIDILHSKMSPADKEETMKQFAEGKIKILVATSLVEVGVNVPNATVIIIEGAERFGLAQLHQLRGRVIRSNHQAYCFVFSEGKTQKTMDRLKALKTAKNGFELAEYDLELRGSGELYVGKQWGISDLAMEAIKNIKMVEAARTEAHDIIEKDPELATYPAFKERIEKATEKIHFE